MKTVRITAKTVEEAVAEGLRQLGATREQAIIHVVEEPSSGLFGLLRKKQAVVDVTVPEMAGSDDIAKAAAKVVSEAFHDVEVPHEEEKKEEPAVKAEPEEKKQEEVSETVSKPSEKKEEAEKDSLPEEKPAVQEEKKEHSRAREEFTFSAEEQKETAQCAKDFLTRVFKAMDVDVIIETMMNEERILLTMHGKGLGLLIGKHGQTLDALQYLTNLVSGKLYHHHYFVMLDVEGYRERRRGTLEALARRCADKARRTGEPVKLEPMPAGERKIIHLALQDQKDIDTESQGEVPYRSVVISLRK